MKVFVVAAVLLAFIAVSYCQETEDRSANSYWCHKRICWSQCNGACAIKVVMQKLIAEGGSIENFNDFWNIIMADGTNCVKCPEWCYINDGSNGYQSCETNSDCDNFKANECL